MQIILVAGGPEKELPDLRGFHETDTYWIGVDRGTVYLLNRGIKPQAAFGDFDSVSEEEWQFIQQEVKTIHTFPAEKDETDLELALRWSISLQPKQLTILGATGGRIDHFFGTISLLTSNQMNFRHMEVEIIDRSNRLSVCHGPMKRKVRKDSSYKYFSFFPITKEVKGFTLEGFKYPLTNHTVQLGSTLYVSNELIGESGTFSFTNGILMVVRSSDD
ncbi:thiamine diphosphokinase [Bacillus sp. PK3_68]|uniref:thiamine diphosphokinase n=1 Tax=Bacillus sp. PK3_68 TaxID=2027408 RepID=UPI000E728E9A|nr:thiamine diphosphokinase [Bacillus sp. PK3_68]RJS62143.1 thiamine diphosphokinase [Bacillus sp. PK3_68]